jgi:glycosyltransferase involved in cell wall biosynthesis
LKFDVVTPSFNQAAHVAETVESVLSQAGEGIEVAYHFLDGGSSDGTLDAVARYRGRFGSFRSSPDQGQAAAIREGLAKGDGDVVAWINSDDYYEAGAFRLVASAFAARPEVGIVYGDCRLVDDASRSLGVSTHADLDFEDLFRTPHLLNQESVFLRRGVYEAAGGVDPSYWGAMDADLWLRAFHVSQGLYLPEVLGCHRIVDGQKSRHAKRYLDELRRSREAMAARLGLGEPEWPYEEGARERLLARMEDRWRPALDWVQAGLPAPLPEGVSALWGRYARRGVLPVRGTTAFHWIGPETLLVVDWDEAGEALRLEASRGGVDASARVLRVRHAGAPVGDFEITTDVVIDVPRPRGRRYTAVEISASSSFVPATLGIGPSFLSLSARCVAANGGESVGSIPVLPPPEALHPGPVAAPRPLGSRGTARPLRIALFNSLALGSGNERLTIKTAESLVARGHEVRVYVREPMPERERPYYVHRIPYLPLEQRAEASFRYRTGLNDLLFPTTLLMRLVPWLASADVWHFHNLHAHFMSLPLLAAVSWTKPILVSPLDEFLTTGYCPYTLGCERYAGGCGECPQLGTPYPGISRDRTRLLRRMKRGSVRLSRFHFLLHTRYLEQHYRAALPGARIRRLAYGVNVHAYRPVAKGAARRAVGIPDDGRFVVGAIHSHVRDPRKGILGALAGVRDLAARHPGRLRILVVGHGSETARSLGDENLDVRTVGFVRREGDMSVVLSCCDALVYPTRAENLAFTCLEALSCGVPVVSYDSGGQGEAVRDGVNGLLVPPDTGALLSAVERLVGDSALQERLARGARETVLRDFDLDRYVDELVRYYEELASGPAAAASA